ncbi:hypothetical protein OIE67_46810 [Nonomuraea fuscirosea]|uniref:hypothetical protein n=1 Tax=Nonomuraea fuscirosea TaxID=1291556 RepID=UPI002DD7CA91|nr:hypothetical protein [Nonomuraea fuscirosea]WSA51483.1 hypothetical protein OIE67_46810 [Nonomuraea fuscirosea]
MPPTPRARGGNPEAYARRALVNQTISWRIRKRPELPGAELPEPAMRLGGWLSATEVTLPAFSEPTNVTSGGAGTGVDAGRSPCGVLTGPRSPA